MRRVKLSQTLATLALTVGLSTPVGAALMPQVAPSAIKAVALPTPYTLHPTPSFKSEHGQSCPPDRETLTKLMLEALPSYANRVMQRSMGNRRKLRVSDNYVIVGGRPEFEPLPLTLGGQAFQAMPADVEQVFFTTLERQYSNGRVVRLQNYYWLFLAPTAKGWYMVALYSQLAHLSGGDVPLPPRQVSEGIIGQAVQLWLRDCRAGALRSNNE